MNILKNIAATIGVLVGSCLAFAVLSAVVYSISVKLAERSMTENLLGVSVSVISVATLLGIGLWACWSFHYAGKKIKRPKW